MHTGNHYKKSNSVCENVQNQLKITKKQPANWDVANCFLIFSALHKATCMKKYLDQIQLLIEELCERSKIMRCKVQICMISLAVKKNCKITILLFQNFVIPIVNLNQISQQPTLFVTTITQGIFLIRQLEYYTSQIV